MALEICPDREHILNEKGHILVTGGPGSGKTTIALKKALVRIEEGLKLGEKVIFLSFSRAAVARIIEAAAEWIPNKRIGELVVHTFHSFFWEILKTHGYLLGTRRKLKILLPHDERVRNGGSKEGSTAWKEWEKQRLSLFMQEGLVTFDLFSSKTNDILCRCKTVTELICAKYPLIIVDEAQDTDEEQWKCIRALAGKSQLLCLADLEQQIYDFRPGVSAKRVTDILSQLSPLRVDFGEQNNRSPDVEIVKFGNDVLLDTPRNGSYKGVTRAVFQPNAERRDKAIRNAVGRIYKIIEKQIGSSPKNIAYLASWGKGVTTIANALRGKEGETEIPHRILFDETEALLSSRFVAFMLEPKVNDKELNDLSEALRLISEIHKARGTESSLKIAKNLLGKSKIAADGKELRETKLTKCIKDIFALIRGRFFLVGNPRKDWMALRLKLRVSNVSELQSIERAVQYLMAFNRGKPISEGLSESWQMYGEYRGAREIVDAALTQEQMSSDRSDMRGIHVMTLHKAKGKEFDGVIIIDEARISPLANPRETLPYTRSRKLLRVGITRAKKHVFLLTDAFHPTVLLKGFQI